jgi:hypothetical protein
MELTGVCLLKYQILIFNNHRLTSRPRSFATLMTCVIVNKKEINKIQKGNKSIKNKKKNQSRIILFNHLQLRLTTTDYDSKKREKR